MATSGRGGKAGEQLLGQRVVLNGQIKDVEGSRGAGTAGGSEQDTRLVPRC